MSCLTSCSESASLACSGGAALDERPTVGREDGCCILCHATLLSSCVMGRRGQEDFGDFAGHGDSSRLCEAALAMLQARGLADGARFCSRSGLAAGNAEGSGQLRSALAASGAVARPAAGTHRSSAPRWIGLSPAAV